MIIITNYASEKVVGILDRLKAQPVSWGCLSYKVENFSGYHREMSRMQMVNNLLENKILNKKAFLLFHENGDITFLAQGVGAHSFQDIGEELKTVLDEGAASIMFYDLSVSIDDCLESFKVLATKQSIQKEVKTEQEEPSRRTLDVDMAYAKELLRKRPTRPGLQIMVVEDDPFTLKLMSNVLKDYDLIRAMDGFDAIETYLVNAPDMVFLDINLPTLDGQRVLKEIQAFDPDCYVVMVSSDSSLQSVQNALLHGAKGYVAKPFNKEKIMDYVKKCLDNK